MSTGQIVIIADDSDTDSLTHLLSSLSAYSPIVLSPDDKRLAVAPLCLYVTANCADDAEKIERVNRMTQGHVVAITPANQDPDPLIQAGVTDCWQLPMSEKLINRRIQRLLSTVSPFFKQLANTSATFTLENSLLQTVIDAIPDTIYFKDPEGRILLANWSLAKNLKYKSPGDLIGKTDFDLTTEERAREFQQQEREVIETGVPKTEMIHTGNHPHVYSGRHLLVTKAPVRTATGDIIGLIGINRDVTTLRKTEAQLLHIMSSVRCLIWYATVQQIDDDEFEWSVQVTNEEAAQSLLPLNIADTTYTRAWLNSIVDEDAKRREYVFKTHLKFERSTYSLEMRCKDQSGEVRWLTEDVRIQRVDDITYELVGVCTDITARKRTEERLQEAMDALEHRVSERTRELLEANEVLVKEVRERKRAEEAERRQRILAESLRDSVAAINQSLEGDDVFDRLFDAIINVVPYDAVSLMLINPAKTHVRVARQRGYADIKFPAQICLDDWPDLRHVYRSGIPYLIGDVADIDIWQELPGSEFVRSNLKVPIQLGDEIIGFLNLDSGKPNQFTPEHAEQLMAFAEQAGNAIRNVQLITSIRDHAAELEQRINERTAQLQHERAQLHAILNAMRDGVVYIDFDGQVNYINPAMIDITGYDAPAWTADAFDQMTGAIDEPVRERFKRRMRRSLEQHGYWEGDAPFLRQDGSMFEGAMTRVVVKNAEGNHAGVLTVLRDISQDRELEQQKARFIAIAAHELRTPIANLKTRLYLMNRQRERFDEHITVATSVVNWMQKLVEDMFDISRFERGVISLEPEIVELQDLIQQVVAMHRPEAERQNIRLNVNMPPDAIIIEVDPFRISQVIINLLTNAINYTDTDGHITVDVQELIQDGQPYIQIQVADTGRGIDDSNLPFLFQPFFRASDDSRGAGLGLSIANEIIRLHHGSISVESRVGEGSSFKVLLPARAAVAGKEG